MTALVMAVCLVPAIATAQDSSARRHWSVPKYVQVQFAGGSGFLSAGAGYTNRKEKGEAEMLYGYVPKLAGTIPIHALTAKFRWIPLKAVSIAKFRLKPLTTGIVLNYTFGNQYFLFSPRNYPFKYYKFPTALHAGLFVGSVLTTARKSSGLIREWGVYYEFTSFDVELASYFGNPRALRPTDIISLGVGVRGTF